MPPPTSAAQRRGSSSTGQPDARAGRAVTRSTARSRSRAIHIAPSRARASHSVARCPCVRAREAAARARSRPPLRRDVRHPPVGGRRPQASVGADRERSDEARAGSGVRVLTRRSPSARTSHAPPVAEPGVPVQAGSAVVDSARGPRALKRPFGVACRAELAGAARRDLRPTRRRPAPRARPGTSEPSGSARDVLRARRGSAVASSAGRATISATHRGSSVAQSNRHAADAA